MRLVVDFQLKIERPGADLVRRRRRRIVAQFGIVHRKIDRVDAEPVDAAVEPEADHVQQRILHRAIVDVELRLGPEEIVHIILAAPRVPRPCRTAEHRLPISRRRAVGLRIGPDIPVGHRIIPARATGREPVVPVRRVCKDKVGRHLQTQRVRARDERVEIVERPEDRIDAVIIGNVVSEIVHWRGIEGRQPDCIDTQRGDIIEPRGDAGQIADPVAV